MLGSGYLSKTSQERSTVLIQDIRPDKPHKPTDPGLEARLIAHRDEAERYLKFAPQDLLIKELWQRGVSIERIFGVYYELEAIGYNQLDELFGNDEDGQHGDPNRFKPVLTVGDAELAGLTPSLPATPHDRQPF